ncbi:MAG: TnpV protein [Clostridia bacterium]|nr:TnpV protein [Clostridia bacterium]
MIYKEKDGLMYPELSLSAQEKLNQGKFAQMRKQFLKTKKKWLWNSLILKEQLNSHLNEIQQKAELKLESGVPETEIIQKIINN